jgi:hypothetical protein
MQTAVPLIADSSTYVPRSRNQKRKRQESESSVDSSELSSLGDESDQGTPPQLDQEDGIVAARAERLMAYAESYQGYGSGIKAQFYQWVVEQDMVAVRLSNFQPSA